MNKELSNVGIIGQGFVGTAVREKFKEEYNVYTYDINKKEESTVFFKDTVSDKSCDLSDVISNCDIVFLCVPTPMFESGKCDTSIVESAIAEIDEMSEKYNKHTILILKSTVPPGTTEALNREYRNVGITFSPEFLTEANSIEDFKNQKRIILGIDWVEYIEPVTVLFRKCFPSAEIVTLNSAEAEMSKYVINLFLATKVSFFNDIYRIIERINHNPTVSHDMSFDSIINAALLDGRIGKSHYMVPGPDGDFGYGGHCFPKDMAAILNIADSLNLPIPTILGASTTNTIVRKNKDWENMKGRAVSENVESLNSEFENIDLSNEY